MSEMAECPLCGLQADSEMGEDCDLYGCRRCGRFVIERPLPQILKNTPDAIPNKHLVVGYIREHRDDTPPVRLARNDRGQSFLASCPQTAMTRAAKIFQHCGRLNLDFGAQVQFVPFFDHPIGYCRNPSEFFSHLRYLHEKGWITQPESHGDIQGPTANVTFDISFKGYEQLEQLDLLKPLTVFLSSTCYDLLDLRRELKEFLESKGCLVRISEDPNSIIVDPLEGSIETCVSNVDSSDVIICILDRRYGGIIKNGSFSGKAATRVEVERAWSEKRPIFYFIRDLADFDYQQLRANPEAKTNWVEQKSADARSEWLKFVNEISVYNQDNARSNWKDIFKTSFDLKHLVYRRLLDFKNGNK